MYGKARLKKIQAAYPQIKGTIRYDTAMHDWRMDYTNRKGETDCVYYANGALLPPEALPNQTAFSSKFYVYPKALPNPADYDAATLAAIRRETAVEKRKNGKISSPYFYDSVFNTHTRQSTEALLQSTSFLGHSLRIHRDLVPRLQWVETHLLKRAKKSQEIRRFIAELERVDGYNWRQIADSKNLSVHSFGLALDLLPRRWQHKRIYWLWEREAGNADWMLVPFRERWMPPKAVIELFEKAGFIWGGKWVIWDNMHFEYAPYLIP